MSNASALSKDGLRRCQGVINRSKYLSFFGIVGAFLIVLSFIWADFSRTLNTDKAVGKLNAVKPLIIDKAAEKARDALKTQIDVSIKQSEKRVLHEVHSVGTKLGEHQDNAQRFWDEQERKLKALKRKVEEP